MTAFHQVIVFLSAAAILLVHAAPQDTGLATQGPTVTSTSSVSSTASAAESATTTGGFSLCPVTDSPFALNFLTCATSPAFDSCSCNMDGLAYKLFFSCAFSYVQERTATATTDQDKQAIKNQVQSVVDQYVNGCKNVGMPIQPLDVTSGATPSITGDFTFSTGIQVTISMNQTQVLDTATSASASGTKFAVTATSASASGTKVAVTASPSPSKTNAGNASRTLGVRNGGVGFAAILSLLMFVIN